MVEITGIPIIVGKHRVGTAHTRQDALIVLWDQNTSDKIKKLVQENLVLGIRIEVIPNPAFPMKENATDEEALGAYVSGSIQEQLILTESDEETSVTVPLVVYTDGTRHVIGEATVKGERVTAEVGPDISEEIMDQLVLRPDNAHFSIGFDEGPNPFRKKLFPSEVFPDPDVIRKLYPKTEFNKTYDGPIVPIDKEKDDE